MTGISLAASNIGGPSRLAVCLGVSPQAVSKWLAAAEPPLERCVRIERETRVSRRDLRPRDWGDIWPELIDAEHPWPPVAPDTTTQEGV
ncbi:MAG: hypothetical protein HKL99_15340 [Burkholderiales bacterium]|jgi:DNA-binding transcriptional regulator YdaS (Cro superfamily)|nr:hypothetical protein [Burkholderiales bacterium]